MTPVSSVLCVACLTMLALTNQDGGPRPSTHELIDRVLAYVREYERELPSIVGDEVYRQSIRESRGGRVLNSDTRVLKSLVSWVRLEHLATTAPVREVLETNNRPTRRSSSLHQLLESPLDVLETNMRHLMDESAAHNLAPGTRNINLPTMALGYLAPPWLQGGRWRHGGRDRGVAILEFDERSRPTKVRSDSGDHLRAHIRLWVDEASGRIQRTELRITGRKGGRGPGRGSGRAGAEVTYRAEVTFAPEERSGLWLPRAMRDMYEYFSGTRRLLVDGSATYSAYRRFEAEGRLLTR